VNFFSQARELTEYGCGCIRLIHEMKTLVVTLSLALAGVSTAQAQVRPSTATGAVIGAAAGGLIGGHNGDRWAEGMVLGTVAGAIIGSAVGQQQDRAYEQTQVYQPAPQVVYQPAPIQQSVVVPNAPVAPAAPQVVYTQPAPQVVYTQPEPQVVYTQPAPPQIVYVESAPRVVYAPRPVVSFGVTYHSGPRYHPSYRSYGRPVYVSPRHHGPSHHHRDSHRGHR
jgi:uncharacterized protein YcfJ